MLDTHGYKALKGKKGDLIWDSRFPYEGEGREFLIIPFGSIKVNSTEPATIPITKAEIPSGNFPLILSFNLNIFLINNK